MIKVEGVGKQFGGIQALREVNAGFLPGAVHALVGENGAGKSTLGKIIAGVFPPSSGRVLPDREPVHFGTTLEAQRAGI